MLGRRAVSQELVMLGEHIRSRRTELCLSQEMLAEKVGISPNTVSRIEGGQMSMTIGIFIKLVRALDTNADRLLGIVPAGEAVFFVNHFSLKKAFKFPFFIQGNSLFSAGTDHASWRIRACSIR